MNIKWPFRSMVAGDVCEVLGLAPEKVRAYVATYKNKTGTPLHAKVIDGRVYVKHGGPREAGVEPRMLVLDVAAQTAAREEAAQAAPVGAKRRRWPFGILVEVGDSLVLEGADINQVKDICAKRNVRNPGAQLRVYIYRGIVEVVQVGTGEAGWRFRRCWYINLKTGGHPAPVDRAALL
jgi:hypothetical protein